MSGMTWSLRIKAIASSCRALWIVLALLGSAMVRADLLYFKQGGRLQIPASASPDGTICLECPGGPVTFLRSDFRTVVPGHSPEDEWPRRRQAARAGGADARFATAWWALENGLT